MKILKTANTFFSAFLPKAMNDKILMAGLLTSQGKSAFSPQKGQWQRVDFHFLYCYKDWVTVAGTVPVSHRIPYYTREPG